MNVREQRAATGEKLEPIPRERAIQRAVDYCLRKGIHGVSKSYLNSLLSARNADGTSLRWFHSCRTHNGKRRGLMVVDVDETFEDLLAEAIRLNPRKKAGNVPNVRLEDVSPPCG